MAQGVYEPPRGDASFLTAAELAPLPAPTPDDAETMRQAAVFDALRYCIPRFAAALMANMAELKAACDKAREVGMDEAEIERLVLHEAEGVVAAKLEKSRQT